MCGVDRRQGEQNRGYCRVTGRLFAYDELAFRQIRETFGSEYVPAGFNACTCDLSLSTLRACHNGSHLRGLIDAACSSALSQTRLEARLRHSNVERVRVVDSVCCHQTVDRLKFLVGMLDENRYENAQGGLVGDHRPSCRRWRSPTLRSDLFRVAYRPSVKARRRGTNTKVSAMPRSDCSEVMRLV